MEIRKLTVEEELKIEEARQEIFAKLRSVPEDGIEVDYLGKKFKVLKGVFWPHEDSKEIVKSMNINNGDSVLDLFTGSGVIAIHAALSGAKKVVAVDINPTAVENVNINAKKFGLENVVEARVSDVFSAIEEGDQFDVITGNPPFSDKPVDNEDERYIEQTIKDTGLVVQNKLFNDLEKYLKPNGRAYFSQANFGGVSEMLALAKEKGFDYRLVGTNEMQGDPRVFYAFEFKRS